MQGLKMANSHLGKPRSTSTCKSGAGAEGGANPEMAAISRLVITESRAAWYRLEDHVQQGKTLQNDQPYKACLYSWKRVLTKIRKNMIRPKRLLTCNPCHNSEARPWGGFGRAIAIEEEWQVILEILKWLKGWALDIWITFGMFNVHCMGCISTFYLMWPAGLIAFRYHIL